MYLKLQYCVSCAIHGKIVRYVTIEKRIQEGRKFLTQAQCPLKGGSPQPCSPAARSVQQGRKEGQPQPGCPQADHRINDPRVVEVC